MAASLLLSWREGVSTESGEEGEMRVQGPGTRVVLRQLAPAVAAALRRLAPPGDDEDRLADFVLGDGGAGALAGWYYCLQGLARRGLVARAVQDDGRRLATLLPTAPAFVFVSATAASDRPYLLSRFAYLRREGGALVLESPLAHARVVLDDGRSAALIGALATPGTARDLAERAGGLPADAVVPMLGLLASAGMLQEVGPDGAGAEDECPALRSWEFHDLLFHARSRKGRSDAPFGATYRMAGRLEPPPAVKPAGAVETCELYRPDLERLERDDPPLTRALEQRRSLRDYGARPITARQLGEFLYRVARVKDYREVEAETPARPRADGVRPPPVPGGGGPVRAGVLCRDQRLRRPHPRPLPLRIPAPPPRPAVRADGRGRAPAARRRILRGHPPGPRAGAPRPGGALSEARVEVRLDRLRLDPETRRGGLSDHVSGGDGHGTGPLRLGGGDSDLFARAAGTDYYAETSVGEFLLGSKDHPPQHAEGSDGTSGANVDQDDPLARS